MNWLWHSIFSRSNDGCDSAALPAEFTTIPAESYSVEMPIAAEPPLSLSANPTTVLPHLNRENDESHRPQFHEHGKPENDESFQQKLINIDNDDADDSNSGGDDEMDANKRLSRDLQCESSPCSVFDDTAHSLAVANDFVDVMHSDDKKNDVLDDKSNDVLDDKKNDVSDDKKNDVLDYEKNDVSDDKKVAENAVFDSLQRSLERYVKDKQQLLVLRSALETELTRLRAQIASFQEAKMRTEQSLSAIEHRISTTEAALSLRNLE